LIVSWFPAKSRKLEEKDAEMRLAQKELEILQKDSEVKAEKVLLLWIVLLKLGFFICEI
jgi:hypothetical protein